MAWRDEKTGHPDLAEIRERINEIDERIQALINERAKLPSRLALPRASWLGRRLLPAGARGRGSAQVLDRNDGPMRDEEMLRLFREIMSACLAQQEPLKIGFLGPEGTFTQTAVFKHFGHSVRALPFHTIDEVFQEVECGAADFGVVPIENSTEGSVNNTLDMFLTSPLKISGEIELKIEQHLMGSMTGLENIERICAHEQSLAQCRGWIREYLPHVELIGMSSNAAGARRARDEDGTAAIGPEVAADVYELKIMVNNIEDRPDNATRFLVVGRNLLAASGEDKTTLLVSTSDTAGGAGVLHSLLQPLAEHGVSMTRIESRPSRRRTGITCSLSILKGTPSECPLPMRWQIWKRELVVSRARRLPKGHWLSGRQLHAFQRTPSALHDATVTVPGDKSVSHRALMLGSIAEGSTKSAVFWPAKTAWRRCGDARAGRSGSTAESDRDDHRRRRPAWAERACSDLDLGNSGTAMRLMAGLLSGQAFDSVLTGDASLTGRPMGTDHQAT